MNDQSPATVLDFRVNITIGALMLVVATSLIAGFILLPSQREHVKFIAAVIGGVSALYSAFYIGKSLRLQVRDQRIRNSFIILEALNNPHLVKARTVLDTEFSHRETRPSEQYEIIIKNQFLHIAVKSLLTIFTNASIAIKNGHADEATLYMALDTLMPYTFFMLKPYVQEVRKMRDDDKVYKNAEDLATSWAGGKYLSSNKDIRGCY